MYDKIQFSTRDLNTMYAAGILHTRESLGFGKNFKKAGVENPTDKPDAKKEASMVGQNAALVPLLEELIGKLGSSGSKSSSDAEGGTGSATTSSPVSTSGKASSGTPAEAKNWSKAAGGIGGLLGGPVGTLVGLGLGKLVESMQKSANEETALQQQTALDNLISTIQNKDTDLAKLLSADPTDSEPGYGTMSYGEPSDSESRSNSQGF